MVWPLSSFILPQPVFHESHPINHMYSIFPLLQARLSTIVEAEPDCSAAMDILGFALYHENTDQAPPSTVDENDVDAENGQKRPLTPDSSVGEQDGSDDEAGAEASSSKKQRLGAEEKDPRNDLKYRIWEEISKGDGEVSVDSMCPDITDRDEVSAAISEMEAEGRVMVSDGRVYQID